MKGDFLMGTRENEPRDKYQLMPCNYEGNGAYRVAESRFRSNALAESGSKILPSNSSTTWPLRNDTGNINNVIINNLDATFLEWWNSQASSCSVVYVEKFRP